LESIKIYSDNQVLKENLKENIASLRSSLIEEGITPREIRLLSQKKENPSSPYETSVENIDLGFEVLI